MSKHFRSAEYTLSGSIDGNDRGYVKLLRAQAEATLALAYEQRTANLIAFDRSHWEAWCRDELTAEGVDLWEQASKQVNERLGLA